MKISSGCLFLSLFAFTNLSQAAAPSGQYGCMFNRNFGGLDLALIANNSSSTLSTSMFYMNFDSSNTGTIEGVIQTQTSYGLVGNTGSQSSVLSGTLAVTANSPITGSYKTVITFTTGGSGSLTMNLMSVNSGNTLLVTAQPIAPQSTYLIGTGVCNKI